MNWASEWQRLKLQLREESYAPQEFKNQFYRHLAYLLDGGSATWADLLLAYRDALLASDIPAAAELKAQFDFASCRETIASFGLTVKRNGNVCLSEEGIIEGVDLGPVYRLEPRRFIHRELIDPALKARLKDGAYTHYNGKAQRLAVRLALTTKRNSTLLVNLPTGSGKTLVAHAASLFSSNNQLTLVVVPTIGLAIEQGKRAKALLEKAGMDHGGLYYWHGGQSKVEHDDVKDRIRSLRQRILFCSPEAACRSLLPVLFDAASRNSLANVVIDEAHIVDQWGAEFRPYFQIIASLMRSLRKVAPDGIKCILMSATFSKKSVRLLEELFGVVGEDAINVNGCFLRPEIQYSVLKVRKDEHDQQVLNAVIALPKPAIVYVLFPQHAVSIAQSLRRIGISRIGVFTGATSPSQRERLIEQWADSELDIMVATSAFGLGMDKADIRSVIHAAVPENLDRFYQEVGRGGRDGLASQSLVIFHDQQVSEARELNNERLITVELGLKKWRAMWDHGDVLPDGRRCVHVSTLRADQRTRTDRNEEWNWRTLLLMQRAGLIRIELSKPSLPSIDPEVSTESYRLSLKSYFDSYYDKVTIMPLTDDPRSESTWDVRTRQRRSFEKSEQTQGLDKLLTWLLAPSDNALCYVLTENYTIAGIQPEYSCGGCPKCLADSPNIDTPTVGSSASARGVEHAKTWLPPLSDSPNNQYIYFPRGEDSIKRIVRNWRNWLQRLLEKRVIQSIRADADVLAILQKELRTREFWIGDPSNSAEDDEIMFWPQLVLQFDKTRIVPNLGFSESVKMVIAPEEVPDAANPNRRWWQSVPAVISLDNFLASLEA